MLFLPVAGLRQRAAALPSHNRRKEWVERQHAVMRHNTAAQEPGMQGASPVFANMSMQQVPVQELQPNFTAWTPSSPLVSRLIEALSGSK